MWTFSCEPTATRTHTVATMATMAQEWEGHPTPHQSWRIIFIILIHGSSLSSIVNSLNSWFFLQYLIHSWFWIHDFIHKSYQPTLIKHHLQDDVAAGLAAWGWPSKFPDRKCRGEKTVMKCLCENHGKVWNGIILTQFFDEIYVPANGISSKKVLALQQNCSSSWSQMCTEISNSTRPCCLDLFRSV